MSHTLPLVPLDTLEIERFSPFLVSFLVSFLELPETFPLCLCMLEFAIPQTSHAPLSLSIPPSFCFSLKLLLFWGAKCPCSSELAIQYNLFRRCGEPKPQAGNVADPTEYFSSSNVVDTTSSQASPSFPATCSPKTLLGRHSRMSL